MEAAVEVIMEQTQAVIMEAAAAVEATLPAPTVSQLILQQPPVTMVPLVEVMVLLAVEVMETTGELVEATVEAIVEVMEAHPPDTTLVSKVATDTVRSLLEVRDKDSTTTTIEKMLL